MNFNPIRVVCGIGFEVQDVNEMLLGYRLKEFVCKIEIEVKAEKKCCQDTVGYKLKGVKVKGQVGYKLKGICVKLELK